MLLANVAKNVVLDISNTIINKLGAPEEIHHIIVEGVVHGIELGGAEMGGNEWTIYYLAAIGHPEFDGFKEAFIENFVSSFIAAVQQDQMGFTQNGVGIA